MAPSISATPTGRPIAWTPNSATAPIVSGIATPSSRQTRDQERSPIGRSSFNPVPKSAITIASSLTLSSSSASLIGCSQATSSRSITEAAPMPSPR